ncbi:hypothetical protein AB1Y20_000440 [Prymnesium parvum]|uniref:Phosphoglycerate mutase n=1 Tax=Prymnesium parvum TaxID=97485 RepID=A0AB34KAF6_PRYPA
MTLMRLPVLALLALAQPCLASTPLRQRYFALRHGQSLANIEGVISSNPEIATVEHGLSEKGWLEAEAAALAVVREAIASGSGVAICCSDFRRARQTALAVRAGALAAGVRVWPEDGVHEETGLRERYFGDFDGKGDEGYHAVWAEDALDADHEKFNVESVSNVCRRAYEVVEKVDSQLGSERWIVILVAHGDVLQILQTRFNNISPSRHRELEHLPTATLRELCHASQ